MTSVTKRAGDLQKRISGDQVLTGIYFDFDNESSGTSTGGGLSVTTTTPSGKANVGINFVDKNENIGGSGDPLTSQVLINSITQGIQILQTGGGGTIPTGGLDVDVLGGINLITENHDVTILANAGTIDISGVEIIIEGASNAGDILISPWSGRYLKLQNLPTSSPGGSDRVWNSGGTLKIT